MVTMNIYMNEWEFTKFLINKGYALSGVKDVYEAEHNGELVFNTHFVMNIEKNNIEFTATYVKDEENPSYWDIPISSKNIKAIKQLENEMKTAGLEKLIK